MCKNQVPYALLNCPLRFNPFQYDPYELWKIQKDNKRIYIADEVGLGKTIEAGIIIKEELVRNENHGKFLIVAPRFLCEQWAEQLYDLFNIKSSIYPSKKNNEDMFDVIILPLSRLTKFIENKSSLLGQIKTIIVDEAHYFRNGTGTRYNNLIEIIKNIENRIFMSATPINNYSSDWDNQKSLLDVNEALEDSKYLTHNKKAEAFPYSKIRQIKTVYCSLDPKEQEFYNTTDDASETEFGKTIFRHIGASSLYALEKCYERNGVDWFDDSEWIGDEYKEEFNDTDDKKTDDKIGGIKVDKTFNYDKDSKAEKLLEILNGKLKCEASEDHENSENCKVVVFAHYLATCEHLVEFLSSQQKASFSIASDGRNANDIRVFSIKGKMTQTDQQDIAKQFKECPDKAVLICSDVCKEGVNLQCANILVNYDLPFNPAIMEQRIGRVDRVGQSKDIYIYIYI